ncbi:MAG: hypothetical protein JSS29_02985 [Proteobacteria bacterium]|nr:hypothetical protein [Pseudomonadota bacterium]
MNQELPSAAQLGSRETGPAISPGKGILALLAVVVFVAAYLLLTDALRLTEAWAGFLFLVCWSFSQLNVSKLAACAVGAFIGVLVAYALQKLPPMMGTVAYAPILGVILVMVYCQIMGWLTMVVNLTTMTFLTVGAMPVVQAHVSFPNLMATLAFGVAYFAGLVLAGHLFAKNAAAKANPSAPL